MDERRPQDGGSLLNNGCVDDQELQEFIKLLEERERSTAFIHDEAIFEERDELLQLLRAYERELRLCDRHMMADGLRAAIQIIEDRQDETRPLLGGR
jgi:hypothetical protein